MELKTAVCSEREISTHQNTRLTSHKMVHTRTTASELQISLTDISVSVSQQCFTPWTVGARGQWGHTYRRLVEVTGSVPGWEKCCSESSKVTWCLWLHHKHVWGSGGTAPRVLKFGTRLGGGICAPGPLPLPDEIAKFKKHTFASTFRNE